MNSREDASNDSDKKNNDARSEELEKKERTSDPADGKSSDSGGSFREFLVVLALIISLAALGGTALLGWQLTRHSSRSKTISYLKGRLNGLEGQVTVLRHTAVSKNQIQGFTQNWQAKESKLNRKVSELEAQQSSLLYKVEQGAQAFREQRILFLLAMANQEAHIAHDSKRALAALRLADNELEQLSGIRFDPVRKQLSKEIADYESFKQPNVEQIQAQLVNITNAISGLPLGGQVLTSRSRKTVSPSPSWSWQGLGEALKHAFSPLLIIRHGKAAKPLITPSQGYFLRQNLILKLELSQIALVRQNSHVFSATLQEAQKWLKTYFDTHDAQVADTIRILKRLGTINLKENLPPTGGAYKTMQKIVSHNAAVGGRS